MTDTLAAAADAIVQHIGGAGGEARRQAAARAAAEDLQQAGLLLGCQPVDGSIVSVKEQVENVLHARYSWHTAIGMATSLRERGLLRETT